MLSFDVARVARSMDEKTAARCGSNLHKVPHILSAHVFSSHAFGREEEKPIEEKTKRFQLFTKELDTHNVFLKMLFVDKKATKELLGVIVQHLKSQTTIEVFGFEFCSWMRPSDADVKSLVWTT